jgi:ADP-ribose pyrophosphatase
MLEKPQRLSRTTIYRNPRLNLHIDKVELPDGYIIEKWHVLEFERAATAVIVENDKGKILFIEAYRYITDSLSWEIPAGGIDEGETIEQAAQREVLEETGYQTKNPKLRCSYYPSNGISNQIFHIVSCQAGTKITEFDKNEVKSYHWLESEAIKDLIRHGKIQDGLSLTALLLHFAKL